MNWRKIGADYAQFAIVYIVAMVLFVFLASYLIAADPGFLDYRTERRIEMGLSVIGTKAPVMVDPSAIGKYQPLIIFGLIIFAAVPMLWAQWSIYIKKPDYKPDLDDTHPMEWSKRTIEVVIPHNEA